MVSRPIAGAISSDPHQPIFFRYASDSDPSLFTVTIDGATYTADDDEVEINTTDRTITVYSSDLPSERIDVEVTAFEDGDGISAHSLPEFVFTTDYEAPTLFAPSPGTSSALTDRPEYFMFMLEDQTGIDPAHFVIEDGTSSYGLADGVYVWGNMLYVPGDIIEMPLFGEVTITLNVQDNVTIGEPNVAVIEVTYETALEGIDEKKPENLSMGIYPNPFNAACKIDFNLTYSGDVSIDIVDVQGRIVKSENHFLEAGYNSVSLDGAEMASGIYNVVVTSNNMVESKKLVLLK